MPRRARGLLSALLGALLPCALPAQSTLTVASYNLENYLPTERWIEGELVPDAMKPEESIAAVVEVVGSVRPDILGLLEMGSPEMLEDLRKRLAAAGMDFPHSEHLAAADSSRHIALLSRFPITARNSRAVVPIELDGRRYLMGRGILDATVQVRPDWELRLVGAHLKSRRAVPEYDQAQFRAREAIELRRHLATILAENPATRLLLFGDLNDTKNEFPIREIIGARGAPDYMMDIWLADSRGERWTHYWGAADVYSRIDYILVSPALARSVDFQASGICDIPAWQTASDHRLIYTALKLPPQS
ncbi:MAG: endonuclease/exonuclease/phosphatase family protein [Terrimicrobiaceae bacterium]|nr:endonuclease/exonuclease/phosphatase family protein [Terrimicrobiaceae bacterium]